jgi:hypothetical protein
MTKSAELDKQKEPWCMFCSARAGEVSEAGENPGVNRATAVFYYNYCSICSYRNGDCADDEAVCVRCDNLMKRISQQEAPAHPPSSGSSA